MSNLKYTVFLFRYCRVKAINRESIRSLVRKMVEEMNTLKGYVRAMLTGRAPFDPPGVTFPKSHMIHAGSIRQAHEMIKDGGYFVVSKDAIQLFKASTSQAEVNFQFATEGKTAVFSELGRAKEGSKTFFARDYWKLRISLGGWQDH